MTTSKHSKINHSTLMLGITGRFQTLTHFKNGVKCFLAIVLLPKLNSLMHFTRMLQHCFVKLIFDLSQKNY